MFLLQSCCGTEFFHTFAESGLYVLMIDDWKV